MAFGRLERNVGAPPMSDINMTPLIDVMLVLGGVLMITARLRARSVRRGLPRSGAAQPSVARAYVVLAVSSDGALFLGDEPIERDALAVRLADAARASPDLEVQLRADRSVAYGRVAELIGVLQQAGLNRIAFVAEPARP